MKHKISLDYNLAKIMYESDKMELRNIALKYYPELFNVSKIVNDFIYVWNGCTVVNHSIYPNSKFLITKFGKYLFEVNIKENKLECDYDNIYTVFQLSNKKVRDMISSALSSQSLLSDFTPEFLSSLELRFCTLNHLDNLSFLRCNLVNCI